MEKEHERPIMYSHVQMLAQEIPGMLDGGGIDWRSCFWAAWGFFFGALILWTVDEFQWPKWLADKKEN